MEKALRTPFQGIVNIIRFNWHYYALTFLLLSILVSLHSYFSENIRWILNVGILLITLTTFVSLAVSFYIYDYSNLYNFSWLQQLKIADHATALNIHAGFDETSHILKHKLLNINLHVFDFYDPEKHTEVSIARARKAYASFPGTLQIQTNQIPVKRNSADVIFNILSAHEIRNREERISFLGQQAEILNQDGRCIVIEHLRDLPNFLAYTIGFIHFYSRKEWISNFRDSGFVIEKESSLTPFISIFILKKRNGDTS